MNQLVKDGINDEKIKLIKSTVAMGATDDELQLFLYTCERTGLDPLTRQIHFVKRGGKMTIQTGIDGYRAIADRSETLAGIDDPVYDTEKQQHPNKATVTVYRIIGGERVPFSASARWKEYVPDGKIAFMSKKMPYLMLGKCAEALALRKAFPNQLSGIYTSEEMAQADSPKVETAPNLVADKTKAKIKTLSKKLNKVSNEYSMERLYDALNCGLYDESYKNNVVKKVKNGDDKTLKKAIDYLESEIEKMEKA